MNPSPRSAHPPRHQGCGLKRVRIRLLNQTAQLLPLSELSVEPIERCGLSARVHDRGGEKDVRFYWRAVPTLLPVWWDSRLQAVRWGNRDRNERKLPPTGMTWRETVEAGRWSALTSEPVNVPATYAIINGVWYMVSQGVRGLLVRTRGGSGWCSPSASRAPATTK